MTNVYCMCGKVGAGKSSYARKIATQNDAVVFNLDELMQPLFDNKLGRTEFDRCADVCIHYLYSVAKQIVKKGSAVVFDFGFWSVQSRRDVVSCFATYELEFVYLTIGRDEQSRRVALRNSSEDKTFVFTEKMIDELNELFEEPNAQDEHIVITVIKA